MFSFEYTIGLNDVGRPIVIPTKKTDKELDFIEHKFMALELSRTIIDNTISAHINDPAKFPLPEDEVKRLRYVQFELDKICDIFAHSIKQQMILLDETNEILNASQQYNIQVHTLNDLHALNYNFILYGDEIYQRTEGLRVKVLTDKRVYELRGGIDNHNWVDVTNE